MWGFVFEGVLEPFLSDFCLDHEIKKDRLTFYLYYNSS